MVDRKKILIIDDDPSIGELVENAGRALNFDATAISDPDRFRALVDETMPELVVMDLQMPQVDGIELLRHLAELKSPPPVVLMSGSDPRILAAAERLGREYKLDVRAVLRKPFALARLKSVFESIRPQAPLVSEPELRRALEAREFIVEYQPIVPLDGGRSCVPVRAVEALVRWNHPKFGRIAPNDFIPVVERCGLAFQLTEQVLSLTLDQLRAWDGQGRAVTANVNLARSSLNDGRLPDRLWQAVHDARIDPSRITFEVTETTAMENATLSLEILGRLRLKGFGLSIDDFGTGYSSLVELHRMPFSALKIDQSFVRETDSSEEARLIVRSIADLAHNLGLTVCAEGVELPAHLKVVSHVGCDMAQGYLFSKPVPPDALPLEIPLVTENAPLSGRKTA
jgi:EAL domain-containing protein (putative c-di-GMP-specific phosphodiesterase class I)